MMEFFEQAHVAKGEESTKKNSKSEEKIKKQLKQMLYGYKKKDNELIKSSMDMQVEYDESSSVSAFSDLNLTASSQDTTQATIGSDDDIESIPDEFNINDSQISNTCQRRESPLSVSNASLAGDSESATFALDSQLHDDKASPVHSIEDISLSASLITTADSDGSEQFDANGLLASKIHQKLECSADKSKNEAKRKFEVDSTDEVSPPKVKSGSKDKIVSNSPRVLHPRFMQSYVHTENENSSDSIKSSVSSLPYVSIVADDNASESFSDVLGEYQYPIMRNLQQKEAVDLIDVFVSGSPSQILTIEGDDNSVVQEKIDENITNLTEDMQPELSETASETYLGIDNSPVIPDDSMEPGLYEDSYTENVTKSVEILVTDKNCVCIMKHPSKIFIHGKVKVSTLAGTVEVFGHTLTHRCKLFAPYYNFAQCLSTVAGNNDTYKLFNKLVLAGLSNYEAKDIVTNFGENDAIVVLENFNSETINFVEEHFSVAHLFSKSNRQTDSYHEEALVLLGCSIYLTQPNKVFEMPSSWKEINKYCYEERSRGIICGGKGVGKSTCLRYHVNKLLAHGPVLLIDLDPGQCEFTVAGNISATVVNDPLLGPNFTHLKKPERALNLGMINTMDNMRRYVNGVIELISYCASDERLSNMRWIINTMGMCNTVGLHFITAIIILSKPTYLFQIDSKNTKKRFDMFLRPSLVKKHFNDHCYMRHFTNITCPENLDYAFILCHHTENPVKNYNSLAPRDERYLNFLAYFGQMIYSDTTLQSLTPYEVQLQDLCVYMNVKIPKGTLPRVINGKIVALCQHIPGNTDNKTFVLAEQPLLCLGHGLIRGIDTVRGILYVITPLAAVDLLSVNTLLYADWVPELRGQEKDIPSGTAVPYRMHSIYQQKQLMFTPRRRFNPLQLIRMTRGS